MRLSNLRRMIDMGVAEDEFICRTVAYVCNVELSLFITYFCIKADVQQDITQFFADLLHITLDKCIGKFEGLLYRVGSQALVGLFSIPRT